MIEGRQLKVRGNTDSYHTRSDDESTLTGQKRWDCTHLCPNGDSKYFPALCKSFLCKSQLAKITHKSDSEPTSKILPNTNKISMEYSGSSDLGTTHEKFIPRTNEKLKIHKRPAAPIPKLYQPRPADFVPSKTRNSGTYVVNGETLLERKDFAKKLNVGTVNSVQHEEYGNHSFYRRHHSRCLIMNGSSSPPH